MAPTLDWLLEYEVSASKRYRRSLSMVLVAPSGAANGTLRTMLENKLRTCDPLIPVNGYLAVVMSETDKEGGLRAIERWRRGLPESPTVFSLTTFPGDGQSWEGLRECAEKRLERARAAGAGVVISD